MGLYGACAFDLGSNFVDKNGLNAIILVQVIKSMSNSEVEAVQGAMSDLENIVTLHDGQLDALSPDEVRQMAESIRGLVERLLQSHPDAFESPDPSRLPDGRMSILMKQLLGYNLPLRVSPDPNMVKEFKASLKAFEDRFFCSENLHEGVMYPDVKRALENDQNACYRIHLMQLDGHEPNVFHVEKSGFWIGTCSKETPPITRNCSYGVDNYMDRDGAMGMARSMNIQVMNHDRYLKLKGKGEFDKDASTWLLPGLSQRLTPGFAVVSQNTGAYSARTGASNSLLGWRGEFFVRWA